MGIWVELLIRYSRKLQIYIHNDVLRTRSILSDGWLVGLLVGMDDPLVSARISDILQRKEADIYGMIIYNTKHPLRRVR